MIANLDARIEKLNVQVKNANDEPDKIKFAWGASQVVGIPPLRMVLASQRDPKTKSVTPLVLLLLKLEHNIISISISYV
jgi:hypothetical protein